MTPKPPNKKDPKPILFLEFHMGVPSKEDAKEMRGKILKFINNEYHVLLLFKERSEKETLIKIVKP